MKKFGANKIVGFDLQDDGTSKYRWAQLIRLLINVIPEFAFGIHMGEKG